MFQMEDTSELEHFFVVQASCKGNKTTDELSRTRHACEQAAKRHCSSYGYNDESAIYQWHFGTKGAAKSAVKRLRAAGLLTKLAKVTRMWNVKVAS